MSFSQQVVSRVICVYPSMVGA